MFVCFTVFTFIAVCILSSCTKTQPAPLINEFVSSNTTDSKLLYQDWIEIYNPGNEAVNLSGYGLSDDLEKPYKWTFPDTTIEPSAYLLIIASGKNKNAPGKKLHCNWKINASGEILLLTDKQGKSIDRIEPVRLLPDISYGRVESADSSYKYFKQPTPGSENTSSAYNEILEQVKFSHKGGFYSDSFYLSLKHSDTDATIYYTLDGSEPSPSNTEGRTFHYKTSYLNKKSENNTLTGTYKTYKYDQPILIKNNSNSDPTTFNKVSSSPPELLIELLNLLGLFKNAKFNKPNLELFKGTIVRAIAVKDSSIPCPISSNSYFVSPDARQRLLPIVALGIQEDQLIGYEDGIYTPGIDFDQWLTENPDNEFLSFNDANYHRRGK
ncbi:MAG: lamin tail domain-containing protein, partial [Chitinophagales bacterium]